MRSSFCVVYIPNLKPIDGLELSKNAGCSSQLSHHHGQVVVPLQAFWPSCTAVPKTVPPVWLEMTFPL